MKISLLPVYEFFGGMTETYAPFLAVAGIVLAFRSKLDGNFALMITALQGMLIAHDSLDDFFKHKRDLIYGANPNPEGSIALPAKSV